MVLRLRTLTRLWSDRRGNVAVIVALAAVPLLALGMGAIEYFSAANDKAVLQASVDSGALAGANKLALASSTIQTEVIRAANAAANANLTGKIDPAAVTLTVALNDTRTKVTMTGETTRTPMFGLLGMDEVRISATATAETLQKTPLCILQSGVGGLNLSGTSIVRAGGCLIHANEDITVASNALIQAERIQAAGTITGPTQPGGNPGAITIADPFADISFKPPTKCLTDLIPVQITIGAFDVVTLPPGVHCSLLRLVGNAKLVLLPGEHYFGAPLELTQNSTLVGDDVVLIFDTTKSFTFGDKANIELTARRSGKYAGFLIATSRENTQTFRIRSDNVNELLGTIYIPSSTLEIEAAGDVAEDSAWSVIVAKSLELKGAPRLVINTNYAGSGVPVPEGVGPSKGVHLTQ